MAKSARASSKKASKTRLRSTVHAPVEDARVQRLSEKLLLLASSSSANNANPTDMDLDEVPAEPATAESASMEDPQEGHVKGLLTPLPATPSAREPSDEPLSFSSPAPAVPGSVSELVSNLPVPASFLEERPSSTGHVTSEQNTLDEERLYNALAFMSVARLMRGWGV